MRFIYNFVHVHHYITIAIRIEFFDIEISIFHAILFHVDIIWTIWYGPCDMDNTIWTEWNCPYKSYIWSILYESWSWTVSDIYFQMLVTSLVCCLELITKKHSYQRKPNGTFIQSLSKPAENSAMNKVRKTRKIWNFRTILHNIVQPCGKRNESGKSQASFRQNNSSLEKCNQPQSTTMNENFNSIYSFDK